VRRSLTLALFLAVTATALAQPANAQQAGNPQSAPAGPALATGNPQQEPSGEPVPKGGSGVTYGGEIDSKVQVDGVLPRGQKAFAEIYAKSVATAYVNVGEHLSFRGEATYERFRAQSSTTAFNSEGLYLSQLYATYSLGPVTAYAGKIHPRFSIGYDRVPGIYDTFANDYEQKERIGFGLLANIAPAWGRHILSGEAYFLDTSVLSHSVFSTPNIGDASALRAARFRKSQGGPSNTQGFDSFDVALDGSRIPGLEKLRYHLGFTREGVSQPGERTETGVTAAVSYEIRLTSRIFATPFMEYAHFDNFAGAAGERRDYLISAIEFDYRKYALSLVAAPRRVGMGVEGGSATHWDTQYSATLGYTIMPRLTANVGYIKTRVAGQVTNVLGTAINYVLRF